MTYRHFMFGIRILSLCVLSGASLTTFAQTVPKASPTPPAAVRDDSEIKEADEESYTPPKTQKNTLPDDEEEDAADVQAVFDEAQAAHEKGNFDEALKLYARALQLYPAFPEAEYQRATIFVQQNRFDEAEKSLRRAIELRADWSLPYAQIGILQVRRNRFDEAEKFLSKAAALDADSFPVYTALTEMRLRQNAAPTVLNALLTQIKAKTDGKMRVPASLYASRAALENRLGDEAAAQISAERALQINPREISALLLRGEIFLRRRDTQRALADAETILAFAPENTAAKVLSARAAAAEGDSAAALKILDSVNIAERDSKEVSDLRRSISAAALSDAEAIVFFEQKLASEPQNIEALSRLCALTRKPNPAKSLEYCRRASQIEPNNISHAVGFGAALVQAKDYEAAITVLQRVLSVEPSNYAARANIALALFQAKRFEEAAAQFAWIIQIKPELPVPYFYRAVALDNLIEYEKALPMYEKFLSLAKATENQLEIDKVNLRLPILRRQIADGNYKKRKKTDE